jgi:predicted ester cyclase
MDTVKRGDLEGLVAMSHPDAVHGNGGVNYRGAQGIRDLFRPIIDGTSEREVQINNVIESGDKVAVEFVFRFKNSAPIVTPQGTLPATGKHVSLPSIGIYELRDGKLAGSRGMYDRVDLLTQLGLMGAPAPS